MSRWPNSAVARLHSGLAIAVVFFLLSAGSAGFASAQSVAAPTPGQPGKDVVWVPTSPELVEKMLDMAEVTSSDFVIDLGSGDGRNVIAAAKRGARALGVEYNPDLVELSRQRAEAAHVSDKATFVRGDMYAADVSQATVLALFLTPEVLDRMTDKFLAMKPGARIVLNTFPITEWEPDATETIGAPCKAWCTAVLVIVPAHVEGTWKSGDTQMTLRQDYQFVSGTLGGQRVTGRLRGVHITLKSENTEYSGDVSADRIEGTATREGRQTPWIAVRSQPPP
jgi:precorrin-6B methylase 2